MSDLQIETSTESADSPKIDSRIPVFWTVPPHTHAGNALGYNAHNSNMMKYSEKYFRYTSDARIAIHVVPANFFRPIKGKVNVLFTMWEGLDLPPVYKEYLPKADLIIVPCKFCEKIFTPHCGGVPIEVCWEGTEPKKFPFHQRKYPDFSKLQRFRYLWVGAPNPRKGYPQVLEIVKLAQNHPNIEVYLKTTTQKLSWKTCFQANWKNRKEIYKIEGFPTWAKIKRLIARIPKPGIDNKISFLGQYDNIIFDTRKIPLEELRDLYNSAHCFLLPSWGEGWGLTLCEAMSTGAPCVSVSNTGTADFFDSTVGYVVRDEIIETDFRNYNFKGRIFYPMVDDFLRQTVEVYKNYAVSLTKGKRASKRIHENFTWEKSAERLFEIIKKVADNDNRSK